MEESDDHLNYLSSNTSLDWRFGSGNLTAPSAYMVATQNAIALCIGDPLGTSTSSPISMADSFSSNIWNSPSSQNLAFCANNEIQFSASASNVVASRNIGPGALRSGAREEVLNVGFNPANSVTEGGFLLQTGIGVLPQNLTQYPTDSAFVEQAAQFSCFNNGNFNSESNPFSVSESLKPRRVQMPEVLSGNGFCAVSGAQAQKSEPQAAEVVKDGVPVDHRAMQSRLTKNEGETAALLVSSDEGKAGAGASNNESDVVELSGSIQEQSVLENAFGEPSVKGVGAKKRKRSNQDIELDQSKGSPTRVNKETNQKGERNATVTGTKTTGKHSKDSCQNSDGPKEEFVHIRARRGQATNSHSLAERVRREKISERMKYLQDLVPGCSKVTGKAVMLDEIINYVQSLQRQVEFLSMKLAAVNPQLDVNIEALLSKSNFLSHGSTPTVGVFPDTSIAYPLLQQGLIQAGIPSIANHSDFLRRTISSQLNAMNGFKEPTLQINNSWNAELHNVVQMSFGTNDPFNNQELSGQMKVEL